MVERIVIMFGYFSKETVKIISSGRNPYPSAKEQRKIFGRSRNFFIKNLSLFIFLLLNGVISAHAVGYVNVIDFGATGNDTSDDTQAFEQAILTGKSIYIPTGTYHISRQLQFHNRNIFGDGIHHSKIVSTNQNKSDAILAVGGNSVISNLRIGFHENVEILSATIGEYVGIKLGIYVNNFPQPFARGAAIRNIKVEHVGTGIYNENSAELSTFSATFDTLEITGFRFRGIDFRSPVRTGNLYQNIYLSNAGMPGTCDTLFALDGEESETVINQLNLESARCQAGALLRGVRAFSIGSIHIEDVTLVSNYAKYLNIDRSQG